MGVAAQVEEGGSQSLRGRNQTLFPPSSLPTSTAAAQKPNIDDGKANSGEQGDRVRTKNWEGSWLTEPAIIGPDHERRLSWMQQSRRRKEVREEMERRTQAEMQKDEATKRSREEEWMGVVARLRGGEGGTR